MKIHKLIGMSTAPMPQLEVVLFHSRKKMLRNLTEREIDISVPPNAEGITNTVEVDGSVLYVVLIEMDKLKDCGRSKQFSLLAHEAVHVAMSYFSDIGEEEPGEEEMAYVVEAASMMLFTDHERYLARHRKSNKKRGRYA